ncbi:MAG: DUF1761 domain-containing protein [Candidatus Binatia bacterium]|nr:DUF1761 domain-containing protein [Candidatus Binatia bacterium]
MPNINLVGVLLAGIIGMGVGALWYGPLFGKQWIKLMGFSKESMEKAKEKGMIKSYALSFVGQLVTAYALAALVAFSAQYFGGFSYSLVFWVWLGFTVPLLLNNVLWEGKPWMLFALNAGHSLVQLMAMGVVINYLV